jgi:hypothetical protein
MADINYWELKVRDMTIADLARAARVPYARVHAEVTGGLAKGLTATELERLRHVLTETPRAHLQPA